ncbi:6,7-dimethyl-8-ribityllumazine synthase [Colletotrichum acutatum]
MLLIRKTAASGVEYQRNRHWITARSRRDGKLRDGIYARQGIAAETKCLTSLALKFFESPELTGMGTASKSIVVFRADAVAVVSDLNLVYCVCGDPDLDIICIGVNSIVYEFLDNGKEDGEDEMMVLRREEESVGFGLERKARRDWTYPAASTGRRCPIPRAPSPAAPLAGARHASTSNRSAPHRKVLVPGSPPARLATSATSIPSQEALLSIPPLAIFKPPRQNYLTELPTCRDHEHKRLDTPPLPKPSPPPTHLKMSDIKGPTPQQHDGSALRIGIVHARWNSSIIEPLVKGAKEKLLACGVKESSIVVQSVPGAWELPISVQRLYQASQVQSAQSGTGTSAGDLLGASTTDLTSLPTETASGQPFDAIIAVGVLIKGETMHFEYIADAVSQGLMRVGLDMGVPVIFGVLTVLSDEQAQARAGLTAGGHNHGEDWGLAAVELGVKRKAWAAGKME